MVVRIRKDRVIICLCMLLLIFVVLPVTLIIMICHGADRRLANIVSIRTTGVGRSQITTGTDTTSNEIVVLANACYIEEDAFDFLNVAKAPNGELRLGAAEDAAEEAAPELGSEAEAEMPETAMSEAEAMALRAATEEVVAAPTEEIWMGFLQFESGSAAWRSVNGDRGRAFGRYQFDVAYALPQFLSYCWSIDSEAYAAFAGFFSGEGKHATMLTTAGLADVWLSYCDAYGESFFALQDAFAREKYYDNVRMKLLEVWGIDIEMYSPVLRGTVWSISLRDGSNVSHGSDNNLYPVTDTYYEGISEFDWLNAIYTAETIRHPSQVSRWDNRQRAAALQALDDLAE